MDVIRSIDDKTVLDLTTKVIDSTYKWLENTSKSFGQNSVDSNNDINILD